MPSPPRFPLPPVDGPTVGPRVEAFARVLTGRPLMPWQRLLVDHAGELTPDGAGAWRWRWPVVVVSVPRRAGKSLAALAVNFQRLAHPGLERARAWYTAQTREDAATAFRDEWAPAIERSPLAPAVQLRRSQGSEGLTLRRTGGRLRVFAPGPTALHGRDADHVVCDEAWAFSMGAGLDLEAGIRPAQLTRPWRQLWVVSAGGTETSAWLDHWVLLGEAGAAGVLLVDYGAPWDADLDDPAVLAAAHPAVGHTVTLAALEAERATMDPATFHRSYLNVWPRPSLSAPQGLDFQAWTAMARPQLVAPGPWAFGVDVSPDRARVAVCAAGQDPDGTAVTVDLVEHREPGDWLVPLVRRLRARWPRARVVADGMAAASVVADLTRARLDVDVIGATDLARACQVWGDLYRAGQLTHRAQPALDAAIQVATTRKLGDAWAWSRRGGDVSPLVAATLAVWGWQTRPAPLRPMVATGA